MTPDELYTKQMRSGRMRKVTVVFELEDGEEHTCTFTGLAPQSGIVVMSNAMKLELGYKHIEMDVRLIN